MADQLNPMTWGEFKGELIKYPNLHLQFEYEQGQFVDTSFHITEIKQAPIVSVDCGGVMNSWTEVIVQLWEPGVKQADRSMTVSKALKIVYLVEKSLPLNPNAVVKIEFGNSKFATRQMFPAILTPSEDHLTVSLTPDFTQCKALSRGQQCGTPATAEACCTPAVPQREISNSTNTSCTPGSGCC